MTEWNKNNSLKKEFIKKIIEIKNDQLEINEINFSKLPKTEEEFREIKADLGEEIIYRILEVIDGYSDLGNCLDLINIKTKETINEHNNLHDEFMTKSYEDKHKELEKII